VFSFDGSKSAQLPFVCEKNEEGSTEDISCISREPYNQPIYHKYLKNVLLAILTKLNIILNTKIISPKLKTDIENIKTKL